MARTKRESDSRREKKWPDCTVEVYMSEEEVTVLRQGAAPRVGASKSSEFGEGKL